MAGKIGLIVSYTMTDTTTKTREKKGLSQKDYLKN